MYVNQIYTHLEIREDREHLISINLKLMGDV